MIVYHASIATADDYLTRREPHRRAHLERLQGLRAAGIVVGGGPAPDGRSADVFYRLGPVMTDAGASHSVSIHAIVLMNALFLTGLTYKVMTKRFVVTWDTGAIAAVYVVAVALSYLLAS